MMSSVWKCPACHAPLAQQNNQFCCANNHSYDIAKEGYVNLLLANQRRSKEPGDSKAMINARRAFLEQDYYQPLAKKLATLIQTHLPNSALNGSVSVFDAGCGEGYYLNQIKQILQNTRFLKDSSLIDSFEIESTETKSPAIKNNPLFAIQASGCDIAKIAIQKAAKKYRQCNFAVASTFHLPITNDSQHALVQVFAPASAEEVHRVLQANGLWLQVNPAPTHLQQLKEMVYDTPQQHDIKAITAPNFSIISDETLTFDIEFRSNEDKTNLLLMTPFYWSASEQAKQQIEQTLHRVTCDFHIQVLKKD